MKPIFTVILSTLGVTLLCGLAFVINLDAAIKKEASKYSKADYAMMTKTVSFPGSVEKLHVATGLDADYYVKDTTGIKVIVTCTKGGMEKLIAGEKPDFNVPGLTPNIPDWNSWQKHFHQLTAATREDTLS